MINHNALISGNRKAQKAFYDQYKVSMFKLCRLYISDRQRAEDALQEGFIKVLKSIGSFDNEIASVETWMRKIFTNVCLMQLRKEKSRIQTVDVSYIISDLQQSIIDNNIESLSLTEIYQLLNKLPSGYRSIFVLYFVEGFTHAEISKLLDISENTSKSQLFKSKKKMRSLIIENFPSQYGQYSKTINK